MKITTDHALFWHEEAGKPEVVCLLRGESKTFFSGSEDEEGWSKTSTTYTHEGEYVKREWYFAGVDCDGKIERGGKDICYLHNLEAGYEDEEGHHWPAWEDDPTVESSDQQWQRDYAAEAMNY